MVTPDKEVVLLIDLGWLRLLNSQLQPLTQDVQRLYGASDQEIAEEWPKFVDRHRDMLAFLEMYVVTDRFICDGWAWLCAEEGWRNQPIPQAIADVIHHDYPPNEVYIAALDAANKCCQKLKQGGQNDEKLQNLIREMTKSYGIFFDRNEMDLHQYLSDSKRHPQDAPPLGALGFYANSSPNFEIERVFFYQAFAREMKVVPFLTSKKLEMLKRLDTELVPIFHEDLVAKIRNQVASQIDEVSLSGTVPCPPLTEMIISSAIRNHQDIVEVATEIRMSENAIKYRQFLAEMMRASHCQTNKHLLKANKNLKPVQKLLQLAKIWGQTGNTGHGVYHILRTLNLPRPTSFGVKEFGVVRALFDLVGIGRIQIEDLLLTKPEGHIAFVASWYR